MCSASLHIFKLEPTVGIRELIRLRIVLPMGIHCDGGNLLLLHRPVIPASLGGGDGIYDLHTGSDLAKRSILPIQMLSILMHDKELAASRIRA